MKKAKFKAGDKVYCPTDSTSILTLETCGMAGYPLAIKGCIAFNEHGVTTPTVSGVPEIFHATAENHALLEQLYGVEFEAPPKPPSAKEIMKKMFDDGWCCVNYHNYIDGKPKTKFITKDKFNGSTDYRHAVIFDPKTGKAIIDYVDGKIVTE